LREQDAGTQARTEHEGFPFNPNHDGVKKKNTIWVVEGTKNRFRGVRVGVGRHLAAARVR
jgi:hypothetical protein